MKINLARDGIMIEYGQSPVAPDIFFYYWSFEWWNFRYMKNEPWWGFEKLYYDGTHTAIWFKPVTISWSSPWTTPPKEFLK